MDSLSPITATPNDAAALTDALAPVRTGAPDAAFQAFLGLSAATDALIATIAPDARSSDASLKTSAPNVNDPTGASQIDVAAIAAAITATLKITHAQAAKAAAVAETAPSDLSFAQDAEGMISWDLAVEPDAPPSNLSTTDQERTQLKAGDTQPVPAAFDAMMAPAIAVALAPVETYGPQLPSSAGNAPQPTAPEQTDSIASASEPLAAPAPDAPLPPPVMFHAPPSRIHTQQHSQPLPQPEQGDALLAADAQPAPEAKTDENRRAARPIAPSAAPEVVNGPAHALQQAELQTPSVAATDEETNGKDDAEESVKSSDVSSTKSASSSPSEWVRMSAADPAAAANNAQTHTTFEPIRALDHTSAESAPAQKQGVGESRERVTMEVTRDAADQVDIPVRDDAQGRTDLLAPASANDAHSSRGKDDNEILRSAGIMNVAPVTPPPTPLPVPTEEMNAGDARTAPARSSTSAHDAQVRDMQRPAQDQTPAPTARTVHGPMDAPARIAPTQMDSAQRFAPTSTNLPDASEFTDANVVNADASDSYFAPTFVKGQKPALRDASAATRPVAAAPARDAEPRMEAGPRPSSPSPDASALIAPMATTPEFTAALLRVDARRAPPVKSSAAADKKAEASAETSSLQRHLTRDIDETATHVRRVDGAQPQDVQAPQTQADDTASDEPALARADAETRASTTETAKPDQSATAARDPRQRQLTEDLRARALERQVIAAARDGSDQIRMQLYPPGLGQVLLRIVLDGGKLKLQARTTSAEAADALRDVADALSDALSLSGLHLASFDVSDEQTGDDRERPSPSRHPTAEKSDTAFSIDLNA